MDLKRIVAQEPRAVAQLLLLYGYKAEPTAENLQNLVKVYGNRPLPYSNATGDTKPKTTFSDIINMVQRGVTTVANVVNVVSGKAPIAQNGQVNVGVDNGATAGATDRVLGMDRKLFIALCIVLLITIAYLYFRKK
jgi:hypothetical protein